MNRFVACCALAVGLGALGVVATGCAPAPAPPPVSAPAAVVTSDSAPIEEEQMHPVPRGPWSLVWSKVDKATSGVDMFGQPRTIVTPVAGATRKVIDDTDMSEPFEGRLAEPPADPTGIFGKTVDLADVVEPVHCNVGDFEAWDLAEKDADVELAFLGEKIVRVWWTKASSWHMTASKNGVVTNTEGKSSAVYVEAIAPGTAQIRLRAGTLEHTVFVIVSR